MKNFFLRTFSSIILLPTFLFFLFLSSNYLYFLILVIFFISTYEILKNVKQSKYIILIFFLLFLFIAALIKIRGETLDDFIVCLWVLTVVWLSDIGGYLIGKLFGKKKLSNYSPNKTYEGFIGSLFFSQFSIFILIFFLSNYDFNVFIFVIQLIISFFSVLGDIFFSYIKRLNNIKDYSNIIPGHGGVLDRIDGLIFSIIVYYYISFFYVI